MTDRQRCTDSEGHGGEEFKQGEEEEEREAEEAEEAEGERKRGKSKCPPTLFLTRHSGRGGVFSPGTQTPLLGVAAFFLSPGMLENLHGRPE